MKKLTAIVLAVVGMLVLSTGCSGNNDNFIQKSYEADAAQITEINIDVRDRAIEVSVSKDNLIHIDYFESDKEFYNIKAADSILAMTAATNKEWTDYIGGNASAENRKISLQVPAELAGSVILSTTNENVSVSALTVTDSLSVNVNAGNISFDKLNVGNEINLKAKNGDINGTIIGGYDDYNITCEIKKGDSNLPSDKNGGNKKLNASNNNGDINIEFVSK